MQPLAELPEGDRHDSYRLPGQMLLIFNPALTRYASPGATLPVPVHGAELLYVRDPAGNSVEFAERRLWGMEAAAG